MTYSNDFDDPPRTGFLANIGPKAAFFIVLIALSFMMGVVWKLYTGAAGHNGQTVPVIRADSAPVKIIPDDAGGMEIQNKDSTLFSSLAKKREMSGRIENLLADDEAEEPLPRSQLFAGLNTEPRPIVVDAPAPTPLDQPSSRDDILIKEQGEPLPTGEPEPEPVVEPEPEPVKIIIPEKVESKPVQLALPVENSPKPVTAGSYYIQLASTKDRTSAEKEWQKLKEKYASIIGGLNHRIEAADLGMRGVYHRIQVGPITKIDAAAKCTAIKEITPAGCLVTQ